MKRRRADVQQDPEIGRNDDRVAGLRDAVVRPGPRIGPSSGDRWAGFRSVDRLREAGAEGEGCGKERQGGEVPHTKDPHMNLHPASRGGRRCGRRRPVTEFVHDREDENPVPFCNRSPVRDVILGTRPSN